MTAEHQKLVIQFDNNSFIYIQNLLYIFVLICLFFLVLNLFSISLFEITYPYPREYRDPALIDAANQFLLGKNPFSLDASLPHTYNYGFIPLLLTVIVSRITFLDLVTSMHIINFLCLSILCFLVGKEMISQTRNKILFISAIIIVLLYNGISLRSDMLAITLTIASLYFIEHAKVFTTKKIIILSIAVIALFYIKQYYVLLFLVVVLYLFFNQSKKSLIYFITTTILLLGLSIYMVNKFLPMYFTETIILFVNATGGPDVWIGHRWNYIFLQSMVFIQSNSLLVLIFVATFILGFKKRKKIAYSFKNLEKPFFLLSYTPLKNIYFLYSITAIFLLTFLLGYHGGSYMTYYHQLLPIPLTLFSLPAFYNIIKNFRYKKISLLFFALLFLFQYQVYVKIPAFLNGKQNLSWNVQEYRILPQKKPTDLKNEIATWNEAIETIKKHKPENVYLNPVLSLEAIKRNWPVYDNGKTEYYILNQKSYSSQRFDFISSQKQQEEIIEKVKMWKKMLDNNVKEKKFSLIVLSKNYNSMLGEDYLKENYKIIKKLHVSLPNLGELEFYEPK